MGYSGLRKVRHSNDSLCKAIALMGTNVALLTSELISSPGLQGIGWTAASRNLLPTSILGSGWEPVQASDKNAHCAFPTGPLGGCSLETLAQGGGSTTGGTFSPQFIHPHAPSSCAVFFPGLGGEVMPGSPSHNTRFRLLSGMRLGKGAKTKRTQPSTNWFCLFQCHKS